MKALAIVCAGLVLLSCGVIGPPIPPEDVGVAPLIERQKRAEPSSTKEPETAESPAVADPQGQDVNLPPLRPVGTR